MVTDRRTVIAGATAFIAAAPITMAFGKSTNAEMSMPDISNVHTAKQFAMNVIGPAELSLATSKIAVERATKPDAKEFAGFELTEAIAVTTVLKELGTPVPSMSPKASATLEKIKSASNGAAFDEAYIKAQIENHQFLRDLAIAYLKNSSASGMEEKQGRHLATLSLATFKEHVAITERIAHEMRA